MIGSTLQQELMQIIMRQLNDPRLEGMPSITRVKVATDLSAADVYVTIMGTEGKQNAALQALRSSATLMREKLRKSLPLRTIPFLKFHIDEALKKELNVLELIEKAIKEEDAKKAAVDGGTTDATNEAGATDTAIEEATETTPPSAATPAQGNTELGSTES